MRHYTSKEQTAKLIELGFEKPKSISGYRQRGPYEYDAETNTKMVVYDDTQYPIYAYSIGELIEMLPEVLAPSNNDDWEMPLSISTDSFMWTVEYDGDHFSPYEAASNELIDALYEMVVKLKEEGVI
jgi:hypothetical protein